MPGAVGKQLRQIEVVTSLPPRGEPSRSFNFRPEAAPRYPAILAAYFLANAALFRRLRRSVRTLNNVESPHRSSNLHRFLIRSKRPEERGFHLRTATQQRWPVRDPIALDRGVSDDCRAHHIVGPKPSTFRSRNSLPDERSRSRISFCALAAFPAPRRSSTMPPMARATTVWEGNAAPRKIAEGFVDVEKPLEDWDEIHPDLLEPDLSVPTHQLPLQGRRTPLLHRQSLLPGDRDHNPGEQGLARGRTGARRPCRRPHDPPLHPRRAQDRASRRCSCKNEG